YEEVLIWRGRGGGVAELKGLVPAYQRKVSDLLSTVKQGTSAALDGPSQAGAERRRHTNNAPTQSPRDLEGVQNRIAAMPPIILGKDMADDLGATVGSVVLVTSPQGELTPFGLVPKYNRFRVAGIFNSGFFDYDSGWAFARLSDAQRLC